VANNLNNLALVYFNEGKYAEAAELFQRALAIKEKALGPLHPDMAPSLHNLALVYQAQGKYAEGRSSFTNVHLPSKRKRSAPATPMWP
jgi:tetratricopeptide (TPR) repeat protein